MKRTRYFQWIEGEYAGNVTKLVNITEMDGEYFYNFDDGETCNLRFISKMTNIPSALKNKFIVEIASPNDKWGFSEIKMGSFRNSDDTLVDVPPLEDIAGATGRGQSINVEHSKIGSRKLTPPRYSGPFSELPSLDDYLYNPEEERAKRRKEEEKHVKKTKLDNIANSLHSELTQEPRVKENIYDIPVQPQSTPVAYCPPNAQNTARYNDNFNDNDPIKILAKTCKKHPTDVDLTLTISLPKKSIFDIAVSEFNDTTGEKFVNYLIENIDINEIISSLKESLLAAYHQNDDDGI